MKRQDKRLVRRTGYILYRHMVLVPIEMHKSYIMTHGGIIEIARVYAALA